MTNATTIESMDLEVKKLCLAPGDMLVIRFKQRLSTNHYYEVCKSLADRFPGFPIMVLDYDSEILTVRRTDG